MGKARHSRDWNEVDWTRPLGEIAQEMELPLYEVCGRANLYRCSCWLHVDWSRTNVDIAKDLGVTRQRVHRMRKRYEAGELGVKGVGRPPLSGGRAISIGKAPPSVKEAINKLSQDIFHNWIKKFSDSERSKWYLETPEMISEELSYYVRRNHSKDELVAILRKNFHLPVDEDLIAICDKFQSYLKGSER